MVRRVLGHRSIQTTISFYCGLETTQANEIFGKLVREHADFGRSQEKKRNSNGGS
jgi:hypothetical protein